MKLTIRTISPNVVSVTTDWTTYTVVFSNEAAQISTFGLQEEVSIEHFPDLAKNAAIAAYLITQLELKSLD